MPLLRRFRVPGRPDRRGVVLLFVLANVPTVFVVIALWVLATSGTPPPGWLAFPLGGCIAGQVVTLAYWFSFSRDTLWFRLGVLFATVFGGVLALEVAGICIQLQFMAVLPPSELRDVTWIQIVGFVLWAFFMASAMLLALYSLAYAVFLPIRRLRGISLGTAEPEGTTSVGKRQFQIYEWMIWTVIVALPLVLVRLVETLGEQPESESMVLYGLLLFALTPLVGGWPVFRAALAERYPLLWSAAIFAGLALFGWLTCEAAFWINIDRLTGSPGVYRNFFSFWPFESFVLSAAAAIWLNAFALRLLGFRILRGDGRGRSTMSGPLENRTSAMARP